MDQVILFSFVCAIRCASGLNAAFTMNGNISILGQKDKKINEHYYENAGERMRRERYGCFWSVFRSFAGSNPCRSSLWRMPA
jgi:hypothetical protein